MGLTRPNSGITSPTKITANVFISFIGAGMLGLPYAFKESGIIEGALIMSMVGYLSISAMIMLIDCKYAILNSGGRSGGKTITMETNVPLIPPDSSEDDDEAHPPTPSTDLTYGDVGLFALGPSGKRLVDIAIVISQVGFCCGYLIYLCKNLSTYLSILSQSMWLILLLPPLYGLTLLRHLNKLAVFSLFAQVSNILALAVVFWFDFSHTEEMPFNPKGFSIKGFPFFFAVSIYCYEGAGMILSLEESVAESCRHKFRSLFICTMSGITLLYITFGTSGYLSFGPHTQDIITLNLKHGEGDSPIDFAALVKICLGISLFFTYPMMLFPVTHLLDRSLGLQMSPTKGNLLRLALVATTGFVVVAVPNFAILMSLIGATCCTLLAFILPATFHMSIFKGRLTKKQWYFDMLLIFLGVVGSVISLCDSLGRMGQDPAVDLNEFSPSPYKNESHSPIHPDDKGIVDNMKKVVSEIKPGSTISSTTSKQLYKTFNIVDDKAQLINKIDNSVNKEEAVPKENKENLTDIVQDLSVPDVNITDDSNSSIVSNNDNNNSSGSSSTSNNETNSGRNSQTGESSSPAAPQEASEVIASNLTEGAAESANQQEAERVPEPQKDGMVKVREHPKA
ncbi:uncharacterized protein LOC143024702 [Oratosquilla oratoria]|uniref:uncharacterized protein LOC143024702 n=1 Tax=Oratosquilla oratoria TaxID=337810 RepID=UPI003F777ADD